MYLSLTAYSNEYGGSVYPPMQLTIETAKSITRPASDYVSLTLPSNKHLILKFLFERASI